MLDNFTIIPLFEYPNYEMTVKLGDKYYILEFIENIVINSVCLNIYDNAKNPILLGMKAVAGLNLINSISIEGLPEGSLFIFTSEMDRDLQVSDDLQGVYLFYTEDVFDDFFEAIS